MKDHTISIFDGDPIQLKEGHVDDGLASFDERNGELIIRGDLPEAGKHVVLIHELLHLAESMCEQAGILDERVNHDFIHQAAPVILAALVDCGFYTGIGLQEMKEFIDQQMAEE